MENNEERLDVFDARDGPGEGDDKGRLTVEVAQCVVSFVIGRRPFGAARNGRELDGVHLVYEQVATNVARGREVVVPGCRVRLAPPYGPPRRLCV